LSIDVDGGDEIGVVKPREAFFYAYGFRVLVQLNYKVEALAVWAADNSNAKVIAFIKRWRINSTYYVINLLYYFKRDLPNLTAVEELHTLNRANIY
jgi:hypothetical protein